MMKIGTVELKNNIFLAPMAGVTDLAFRTICDRFGAGLSYTEMVSAKALSFADKKTGTLMKTENLPTAVQLFGSDPSIMADAVPEVEKHGLFTDINMGCPAPKIAGNGEGSALMRDLDKAEKIIGAVCDKATKPVTVKMRSGWDENHINAVELARIAEKCGASAVTVHGRTREQYYSGKADWDIIRQVKEAVSIPVIGNGDVTGPESAKKLVEETGVDGIMIGRAARGNPWIFQQISEYMKTGEILPKPSIEEVREMMLRHARMQLECKGEYTGIREMRKHVAWYTAGYPKSAKLRAKINEVETYEELEELLMR